MGTTLTGTTPQDTYDSLIKVTDNGPLSGTAKYLSDGLGNDSALALSTAAVSIGTATPNTKLTVFQSGASGIATMDISGGGTGAGALQISAGRVLGTTSFDLIQNNAGAFIHQRDNNPLGILVNGSERLSITSAGNVGIGTSSPAVKLDVVGVVGADGIKFPATQVPSADVNTLDDYEEGTWTPVDSSGGGLTFVQAVGTYTKIGREVFVRGFIQYPTTADANTAILGGLPFTTTGGLAGRGGNVTYVDKTTLSYLITNTAATTMSAFNSAGVATTNVNLSDAFLYFSANYNV